MTIAIKSTNIELTPALKDYAEKRLGSIVKFTNGTAVIDVELGKSANSQRHGGTYTASVTVQTPLGKSLHASSEKTDLYEAIDDVRSEIVRELKSAKGKNESLYRRGAQKIKNIVRGLRSK